MEKDTTKTKDLVKVIALKVRFPFNKIDKAYKEHFQRWLWKNSHEQEPLPESKDGIKRFEFDEDGFITNVSFSKKTRSGFDLLEQDFINIELKRINSIDTKNLDLDNQKYIEFLKSYFESKEAKLKAGETKTIQNIDNPKPKKRKTLFHVISYILDSHANKKPLPIGIKTTIEKHANERLKYTGSVNTFYKCFNEIGRLEINKSDLKKTIGEDWRNIVLELSDNPEKLKTYLDEKM